MALGPERLQLHDYAVQRATDPNGPFTTLGHTNGRTWQDTGLAANTVYYYRVIANYNSWTSLPSGTGQVVTAS